MWSYILDFIFPNSCLACGDLINKDASAFCLKCYSGLPFTYWKWNSDNLMFQKLHAFLPIESANSLFYFQKGNSAQKMLHALKYQNRSDLSDWLVHEIYRQSQIDLQDEIDSVTSVPVHKKKLKKRGYNQNSEWGKRLAHKISAEYNESVLRRIKHQKSQTLMHRAERLSRLENTFEINDLKKDSKHILLIDDVCTTGATLLHCADLLLKQNKKVSIATLAFAI